MTSLVVVESPNKVPKISSILGSGFSVLASVGHIRDLPANGDMGFAPPDFEPHYEEIENKKNVIFRLRAAAKKADTVYLATDPDREGEAIAYHIAQAIGLKPINAKRVTFNAVTPDAVKAAFKQPRDLDIAMVHSQQARRVLDRAIGWEVSKLLRSTVGFLTAGRVQTVAVRLIRDRENEIKNFQPINHFVVEAKFDKWKATLDVKSIGFEQYLLDNNQAKHLAEAIRNFKVSGYEEKPRLKAPPSPFTTTTLQAEAGRLLKFSTAKTMQVAQNLFAKGFITYHRTDAPHFAPEGIEEIKKYLTGKGVEIYAQTRVWKAKIGAQEGHEAIRPSHIENEQGGDNADEKALYTLIRKRAIATVLPDAVYATKTVKLETQVDGRTAIFKATSSQLEKSGWLSVYNAENDADKDNSGTEQQQIPTLKIGDEITPTALNVVAKKTQPPSRFDEPHLVMELEKRGIGRPSTYASIITRIIDYKYVVKDKQNHLVPSDSADKLCDAVVGKFSFAEYDYTKGVEEELDEIAEKKNTYLAVVSNEWNVLQKEIEKFNGTSHAVLYPCPKCGKPLARRKGKNGYFWGCTGYPDCKTILFDVDGKPSEERKDPTTKYKCQKCGAPLRHLKGTSKTTHKPYDFFSCSGKECKQTYPAKGGKPDFTAHPKK